jgi:hypothetical protein
VQKRQYTNRPISSDRRVDGLVGRIRQSLTPDKMMISWFVVFGFMKIKLSNVLFNVHRLQIPQEDWFHSRDFEGL